MKKIIAGLGMATFMSGVVSLPTMASAAEDPPQCAVSKALPPQVPINPGCGHGS